MKIGLVMLALVPLTGLPSLLDAAEFDPIGVVLAVQGTVTMQPATMTPPQALKPFDEVGPLSIFDSRQGSRCKVLYADDSMITLGDDSRLEITEQLLRMDGQDHAFVAHLVRGSVRALVTRPLDSDNAVFQVHAGTSLVSARGTYFVAWVNGPASADPRSPSGRRSDSDGANAEGATGVANIGSQGNVAFNSGGATVLVLPGQFSIALPGQPPSQPASTQQPIAPVASAISGTQLPDHPKPEAPREALAAAGIGRAGVATAAVSSTGLVGMLGGQAPSGSYMLPTWPFPITPVTPPAVVSGAAPASVNPAAGSQVNLSIRLP